MKQTSNYIRKGGAKRFKLRSAGAALLSVILAAASFALPSQAQTDPPNIVWVSFHPSDNTPSTAAATAGFTQAPDITYTKLLSASGANVTRYITTGSPDAATLNAADLIIVSRSAPSGNYQNASATSWNSISAPMIVMSGYLIRSNRMGWVEGNSLTDTFGLEDVTPEPTIALTVNDPSHPIFSGIQLDGDNLMVNPFAHRIRFGGVIERGISVNTAQPQGGGVTLATVGTANDPGFGAIVIAELAAGAQVTHEAGEVTDTLAGDRLVFLSGSREHSGLTSEGSGIFDLNPDGVQLFFNAVNHMAGSDLIPPPLIENVSVTNGEIFVDTSAGLSFTVTSSQDVAEGDISVTINGEDVTSSLQISGTATAREVTLPTLPANEVVTAVLTVATASGSISESVNFDTFSEEMLVIEAEDFNFGNGMFFDNIVLCNDWGGTVDGCYFDRVSVSGVDALDTQGTSDDKTGEDINFMYRLGPTGFKDEHVDTFQTTDAARPKYENAPAGTNGPIWDYDVELFSAGDWMNYTRTVDQGTYTAYLRVAGSAQSVQLGIVTSDASQPDQTVDTIGEFAVSGGGYQTIALTGVGSSEAKAFQAGGETTFRLTTPTGGGNLRLNYLVLVPTGGGDIPSTVALLSPEDGLRVFEGTDIAIEAAASGPDGTAGTVTQVEFFLNGNSLSVDTSSPFTANGTGLAPGMYAVTATATDSNGGTLTTDPVSFEIREVVTANLGSIVFVSFHSGDDTPSQPAIDAQFSQAPDVGYTEFLRASGYEVTRYVTTGTPDPTAFEGADLVIISRSTPSGDYQNVNGSNWNAIEAPIMILGGYVLRNSRMGFTTGGTMLDTPGDVFLSVQDPSHPIFRGIALDGDNMTVNSYAHRVTHPIHGQQLGISINNNPLSNGTLLATDTGSGGPVIAEWEAGAVMANITGSNPEGDILAGHRLVFLTGSREAGITSQAAGLYDLDPDGETMFLNAVAYMINPNPVNAIFVTFHATDDAAVAGATDDGFAPFAEAPDKGYTDLLAANGITVTRHVTSNTPDAAVLNAADVVIIGRSVNSGHYQDAGATAWNSIQAPMVIMGGYTLRNSRMGFTTGGNMLDTTGTISLNVLNPSHPIFIGAELDGDNTMMNPFADVVSFPYSDPPLLQRGISVNTNSVAGDGTVLATVVAEGDPTAGHMIIGEWQAGSTMGNGTADTLAGPRVVFLSGSRESGSSPGVNASGAGLYDLTEAGATLFINAVRYAASLKEVQPAQLVIDDTVQNTDGTITITWTSGGSLETTASLTNPDWQPVAGDGSATVTVEAGATAFYRLAQ